MEGGRRERWREGGVKIYSRRLSQVQHVRTYIIGHNASCALGDCLTSRPECHSWPRELWFSIFSYTLSPSLPKAVPSCVVTETRTGLLRIPFTTNTSTDTDLKDSDVV